jgi:predicted ATPase/tetratricopeptide (TPR) repeat protein
MGSVYLAEDETLGRKVAVKVLAGRVAGDATARARFLREARVMATLQHPNVVTIHAFGEVENQVYLIMELVEGESLSERIRAQGRLDPRQALTIVRQAAEALEAAWEKEIVHRDIKPSNILLDTRNRVKVADFGLARPVAPDGGTEVTAEGVFAGTPLYMSPEQAQGRALDHRSDLYSLGIVLYEALSGERPFAGGPLVEIAYRQIHEPLPALEGVPSAAAEIAESLTAKEPDDRLSSHAELLTGIDEALESLPEADAPTLPSMDGVESGQPAEERSGTMAPPGTKHSLPAEVDTFVGRESEIAELAGRFESGCRLLTLLGPGGMGKTRLARRYGWDHLEKWPGGIWFCDLSEARSPNGIASAVAGPLGVQLSGEDPAAQLGHAIAGRRRCLMILDNFEQIVEHAAPTVGAWLERAPEAAFLITSRVKMDLPGEHLYELEPLPVDGEALDLFVARAGAKKRGFQLGDEETAAARELVRLLDGLPLAIELAAARTRILSPSQIVARLEDRFKLLAGAPGKAARQATLRTAIDWSWDLLQPWEQAALAQCSVFEGGFTLEAAEAVLDLSPWPDAPWPLDVVQALVDKSLLRTWDPSQEQRLAIDEPYFKMYLSIQEYAAEKLRTEGAIPAGGCGPAAEAAAFQRHGRHFAGIVEREGTDLDFHGGASRKKLSLEIDNLVTACRRAIALGDGTIAASTLRVIAAATELAGPEHVVTDLGERILRLQDLDHRDRIIAHFAMARALLFGQRVDDARGHLERAIEINRELGDPGLQGRLVGNLADIHHRKSRYPESMRCLEESIACFRESGERSAEGRIVGWLGLFQRKQPDRIEEAKRHLEQAVAIFQEIGDTRLEGHYLGFLAVLAAVRGEQEEAQRLCKRVLTIFHRIGERRAEGMFLFDFSRACWKQGRRDEAFQLMERAIAARREHGDRRGESWSLVELGEMHHKLGRIDQACHCLEQAAEIKREVGDRLYYARDLGQLAQLEMLAGRPDRAREHLEENLEIVLDRGDSADRAIHLGSLGTAYKHMGQQAQALKLYEQAIDLARSANRQYTECWLLGELGELHLMQGNLQEARSSLERALEIDLGTEYRQLEAFNLGRLGLLHAREGRFDEAREALAGDLDFLQGSDLFDERCDFGVLLCWRAEVEHLAGDHEAARSLLARATDLTAELGAGPDSPLGRRLAEISDLVERKGSS